MKVRRVQAGPNKRKGCGVCRSPCAGVSRGLPVIDGEIAEAPPVADEARRFRGSAPAGGHDNACQSAGTTVGRESPKRRRWRMKQGDFEEVPRSAGRVRPFSLSKRSCPGTAEGEIHPGSRPDSAAAAPHTEGCRTSRRTGQNAGSSTVPGSCP